MSFVPDETLEPRLGEYRVDAAVEIHELLRQLLDGQVRITLSGAGGASVNTRLCALDPVHGALGFDVTSPHDPQLQALMRDGEVSATGYLDLIRVAFDLEDLVLVQGGQGSVLRTAMPEVLLRFQRRQAFRVKPNTRTPQARLMLPGAVQAQRLRIVDLSVGGLALLAPPGQSQLPPEGSEIEAQVELDRESRLQVLLRLQHVSTSEDAAGTGDTGARLGFAWAKLDPAAQRTVQLFIDQTQKLNRLLLRKT